MTSQPREVLDLASDLINFGWSKEDADSTAISMQALPKFRTFNSYYLAAALELQKRIGMAKQKPKTPNDYSKIIASILAVPAKLSKSKRRPVKTQEVKDREPYTVVSYWRAILQIPENQKNILEDFISEEENEDEEEDDVGIADIDDE